MNSRLENRVNHLFNDEILIFKGHYVLNTSDNYTCCLISRDSGNRNLVNHLKMGQASNPLKCYINKRFL